MSSCSWKSLKCSIASIYGFKIASIPLQLIFRMNMYGSNKKSSVAHIEIFDWAITLYLAREYTLVTPTLCIQTARREIGMSCIQTLHTVYKDRGLP